MLRNKEYLKIFPQQSLFNAVHCILNDKLEHPEINYNTVNNYNQEPLTEFRNNIGPISVSC